MISRGLGFLRDPEGTMLGVEIGQLVGAFPHVPERVDLSPLFERPHIRQRGNSCVGAKLAYCFELHGLDVSYEAIYALAREYDYNRTTYELEDVGCYPHRAVEATCLWGLCARTRWENKPLTEPVPIDVLEAGSIARVTGVYSIESRGRALSEDIRSALGQGHAVFCGSLIDERYRVGKYLSLNTFASNVYSGRRGESIGGHAWCIVGCEPGVFRLRESWGRDWADGGDAWVTEEWLTEGETFSFTVFTSAPREVR